MLFIVSGEPQYCPRTNTSWRLQRLFPRTRLLEQVFRILTFLDMGLRMPELSFMGELHTIIDRRWKDFEQTNNHNHSYTPSLALCVVAIILYAITLVLHVFQVTKYKLWSFAPLSFGCLLETVGYIFRTLSSQQDPYNSTWFVIQYFFIVVAPVFISASIYGKHARAALMRNYIDFEISPNSLHYQTDCVGTS